MCMILSTIRFWWLHVVTYLIFVKLEFGHDREWSAKRELQRFMVDNAQANRDVVMKFYGEGDPSLSTVGCECMYLFHWFASLDKVMQK